MKSFFYLKIILILGPLWAFAGPDKICDDLQKFVCAPGEYDDGTGVASNTTILSNPQKTVVEKVVKIARDGFAEALKKPENTYFRKSVLSATGLSISPRCEGAENHPSSECLSDMVSGGTDIFFKQQSSAMQGGKSLYYIQAMAQAGTPVDSAVVDVTYVIDSPAYRDISKKVFSQTKDLLHSDDLDKKARDVFPKIQALLIQKIEKMVKDPTVKKNLIDKVKDIHYESSDCSGSGGTSVPGLLMSNAFYNPSSNQFQYCAGMGLQNKSEFQMAFVIAHELSHSIDPCDITLGPSDFAFHYPNGASRVQAESAFPIKGVLSCLRSENSVKARAADQAMAGYGAYGAYGNANGDVNVYNGQPLSQPAPFTSFCTADQITESFADWMAAEITPDYMKENHPTLSKEQLRYGYSNIWRGMCIDPAIDRQLAATDTHPAQVDRSNKTILLQPKIREQMGCPTELPGSSTYCPVSTVDSTEPSTVNDKPRNKARKKVEQPNQPVVPVESATQ